MYSNKINPADVLGSCNSEYTLLKVSSNFPNYKAYSDLDILCRTDSRIIQECKSYVDAVYGIHTEVHKFQCGNRIHLDLFPNPSERLDFKFDFINSFSVYKKTIVDDAFIDEVLDNKVFCRDKGCWIPSLINEMVIRMLEYIEYIDDRPDKIKHLRYVSENLGKVNASDFFDTWDKFVRVAPNIRTLLEEFSK